MKPRKILWALAAGVAVAAGARAETFAEKLKLAEEQAVAAPVAPKPKKTVPTPTSSVQAGSPRPAPSPIVTADPLAAVNARLAALEGTRSAWDRFKFEAFAHLRYDSQDSKRVRGLYARRVETKLVAKLWDQANGVFGYDFAENKLKDLGLELDGLPLWPGADDWRWKLQVGQFRQKFGIEPQTGSTKVWFAERALVYGGAQPTTYTVKLVAERAMGLHALQQKSFGPLVYSLGLSVANDLSEDQAVGKNRISPADAFPKQSTDENPSFSSRLGLDLNLGAFKAGVGGSYARDNQNNAFLATKPADQRFDEILGWDLSAEVAKLWKLQGEWVASNALRGDLGLSARREGWVLQQSLQPWRFFSPEAPQVELLARYESLAPNVHLGARSLGAATAGLKWAYGDGRQQLLLQYTAYALNNDFGAAAGTELWVLQQQLQF
jgi:hypothetical protein